MPDETLPKNLPWLTLLAIGVTLVGWIVVGTYRFAQLEEFQQSLQRESMRRHDQVVNELRSRTDDRYHASTARARNSQVDERFLIIRGDIERIETKFQSYPPEWLLDDFRELRSELTRRIDQQEEWISDIWGRHPRWGDTKRDTHTHESSPDIQR